MMNYFKNFDIKIMANRVVTFAVFAFLSAFSTEWLNSKDLQTAVQAGLAVVLQAAFAGLGFDQLVYNFFKQPQVETVVKALSTPVEVVETKATKPKKAK